MTISHKPEARSKGFTLIELLISMTVTMVIIGALMAMTRVAIQGVQSSQNATRSSRLSQEILTTLSKDLEAIVIRPHNDFEWVKVKKSSVSGNKLGPEPEKQIVNPVEISFFTAATDRYDGNIGSSLDKGGDISLVRYKLTYQDIINGPVGDYKVFSLYRNRVNPNKTYKNHLALSGLSGFDDPVTGDDFLAENIFDLTLSFNFEIKQNNGTVKYKRVAVQVDGGNDTALSISGDKVTVNGSQLEGTEGSIARLVSADISILVLSDKGMNGLKKAKIKTELDLAKYLRENGKHFTQSVILPR